MISELYDVDYDSNGLYLNQNQFNSIPLDQNGSNFQSIKFFPNEYNQSFDDEIASASDINDMTLKLNDTLNDSSHFYINDETPIPENSVDIPFLHPRDTKDFTPFILNTVPNDWLNPDNSLDYSPQDSTNESDTESEIVVTADIQENLFNRLQWYHVTCKFVNRSGEPVLCGRTVILDQSVQFVDGRRRVSKKPTKNLEGPLYISVTGVCASTGRQLQKCKRCKEKDKVLRKRKRKRQENYLWNESDEENNDKLIQLHSTGENVIDNQGELRFRIRVGCCIGVSKQHHINHVGDDNNKLEIHKNCEGMILTFITELFDNSCIKCSSNVPIRILGKVTEAERQKVSTGITPYIPEGIPGSHEADIEEIGNIFTSSRNFVGCSSCAAKGDKELFSNESSSKGKPSLLIQYFTSTFSSIFENVFSKKQIENMCNDSFFINPPMEKFEANTPSMLQVLTILAVGACMSGYLGTADLFWDRATKLANFLSTQTFKEKYEALLFVDGLNRVSFYYGSGSEPIKGAYYSERSYKCLMELSLKHPDILDLDVYETTLWSLMTFTLDRKILSESRAWALKRDNLEVITFSTFLQVISSLLPDLREFVLIKIDRLDLLDKNFEEQGRTSDFNALKEMFKSSEYYTLSFKNHSYSKLIDDGFGCIEDWLNGDKASAMDKARSASIQCSLIEHPQYPLLIPTYLTCIVCVWISETRHPSSYPYIDYAELCIKSLARISHYRWIRIIIDYIIKKIDVISGRCIEMNTCPLRDKIYKATM